MNIKNQVTSLKLSKQLERFEVKQESIWVWAIGGDKCEKEWTLLLNDDDGWSATQVVSAFSVSELGEILKMTEKIDLGWGAHTEWNDVWKKWTCFLINGECETDTQKEAKTEANARAKMLIYLIENKLIKL